MLAGGLVADAEQPRTIGRGDDLRDLALGGHEKRRTTFGRTRIPAIQCAAVLLLARDQPKRGVVGGEELRLPRFGVAVKLVPGDGFETRAVVGPVFPDDRATVGAPAQPQRAAGIEREILQEVTL